MKIKSLLIVLSILILACQKEGGRAKIFQSLEVKLKENPEVVAQQFVQDLRDSNVTHLFEQLPNKEEYLALLPLWDQTDSILPRHRTFANTYVMENVKHVYRWIDHIREKKWLIKSFHSGDKIEEMGPYSLHRGVYLEIEFPDGKQKKVEIFSSMIEKDGRFMPWSVRDTKN